MMSIEEKLQKVLTNPTYEGGVQWWIRKHDALLEMNLRLVLAMRQIAALPTDQLASPNQCSAVIIAMDALSLPNTGSQTQPENKL